jgi:hypothetical protein
MPDPVTGLVVGGGALLGARSSARGAERAAGAQSEAASEAIAEQRYQFDKLQELLKPYVEAGPPALQQQQAFLGLRGAPEQEAAISALEQSPLFQSAVKQGEEALLQQASATGGLRGGNIQAALAQFRPAMLQEQIAQQYQNLAGLTSLGQRSAAGQGAEGMQSAGAIGNLLGQRGAAIAGGALGKAQAYSGLYNLPAQVFGAQIGAGGKAGMGFGGLFG